MNTKGRTNLLNVGLFVWFCTCNILTWFDFTHSFLLSFIPPNRLFFSLSLLPLDCPGNDDSISFKLSCILLVLSAVTTWLSFNFNSRLQFNSGNSHHFGKDDQKRNVGSKKVSGIGVSIGDDQCTTNVLSPGSMWNGYRIKGNEFILSPFSDHQSWNANWKSWFQIFNHYY